MVTTTAISIFLGAILGCLACFILRGTLTNCGTGIAVGILGSLVGLAAHFGMGEGGLVDFAGCEYVAAALGAVLALGLWCVAQKLFLATPPAIVRKDNSPTR